MKHKMPGEWIDRLRNGQRVYYADSVSSMEFSIGSLDYSEDEPPIPKPTLIVRSTNDTTPQPAFADLDEECQFCGTGIEGGSICFKVTPCNHLYCEECVKNPGFVSCNKCVRCNREMEVAEPVVATKVKIEE